MVTLCIVALEYKDVIAEIYNALSIVDCFRLAGTSKVLRWRSESRLGGVRGFLLSRLDQVINYSLRYDIPTRLLVEGERLEELGFIYSVLGRHVLDSDAEATRWGQEYKILVTWIHEGFAQSWMFDKPRVASWFINRLNNVPNQHPNPRLILCGCSITLLTLKHCLLVSHREGDQEKWKQIQALKERFLGHLHLVMFDVLKHELDSVTSHNLD